ncbi:MAG: SUMF1/EgtB/PvdO family nonheme iron enzyme [Brumimicrobium sp.]
MKHLMLIICSIFLLSSTINKDIKLPKSLKKQFKFIPSGVTLVDEDTLSVQSFYMLSYEVTNAEYNDFLETIKNNDPDAFKEARVRNEQWTTHFKNTYVEPMEEMYHVNKAYNDYPVVNITQKGAKLYCEWLEKKINKQLSDDAKIKVRLPSRAEFIRAGAGSNLNWQYAWGNENLRNSEGQFLCNFTRKPQSSMSRDENGDLVIKELEIKSEEESTGMDFTSPKNSYYPNTFEIYNLNGNVAEWLGDLENQAAGGSWYDLGYDVRLQSVKTCHLASPEVGFRPVFTVD